MLQDVYKSESDTNQRNQAIGALMLAYGYIKNNWQQAVDLYTRQCSIGVNAKDLATMAATLAFGGKNPVTGKQVMDADEGAGRARGDGNRRPVRRLRQVALSHRAPRARAASAAASLPSRPASSASPSCRRRSMTPATACARSARSPTSRTRSAAIRMLRRGTATRFRPPRVMNGWDRPLARGPYGLARSITAAECRARSVSGDCAGVRPRQPAISRLSARAVLGTLLAGLLVGQVGITVPAAMQSAFFLLFLFAIGFRTGPDFFHGLRSSALPQIGLTVLLCVVALGLTWTFAIGLALDGGTAAGLLAGALTNSTALGTATRAALHSGPNPWLRNDWRIT